jgi:hypothetical protein
MDKPNNNHPPTGNETMDAPPPTKLLKEPETTPEEIDEITAWWQKALGTKSVLGQASNQPPSGVIKTVG